MTGLGALPKPGPEGPSQGCLVQGVSEGEAGHNPGPWKQLGAGCFAGCVCASQSSSGRLSSSIKHVLCTQVQDSLTLVSTTASAALCSAAQLRHLGAEIGACCSFPHPTALHNASLPAQPEHPLPANAAGLRGLNPAPLSAPWDSAGVPCPSPCDQLCVSREM